MSARRRCSPSPSSSSSSSSRSESPVRVVRGNSSRLSAVTTSPRDSQNVSAGVSKQASSSGSRARRATPLAARRSTGNGRGRRAETGAENNEDIDDDSFESSSSNEDLDQNEPHTRRRHVTVNTAVQEAGGRSTSRRLDVSATSATTNMDNGQQLTWYERLMPEFLLNWTAPLTGYERQLEAGQLSERDYEILERERLLRNRRVRRRLMVMLAVASLASAYFFYRGRVPMRRPQGVRGAINEVAHRIEDGFSKTFHDTIGK